MSHYFIARNRSSDDAGADNATVRGVQPHKEVGGGNGRSCGSVEPPPEEYHFC